jgi:lipid A 4'-phosphatase
MPFFFILFGILLALPVVWPQLDLFASSLFYQGEQGFYLANNLILVTFHWLAFDGARALGVAFAFLAFIGFIRHKPLGGINGKAGLFLLMALLVGPGLVANAGLKDHWGRARPREVVEFGGNLPFTPVLEPHFERAHSNGSFVAGDGAFGFFLPAFAYIVPRRSSRRVFWGSMALGSVFGFVRLLMGAHFLSDILYSAAFMLATTALVHTLFYGKDKTIACWRNWFGQDAPMSSVNSSTV